MLPLSVEFYVDQKREHRYRVRSPNGEIVLNSEGYENKRDAEDNLSLLASGLAHAKVRQANALAADAAARAVLFKENRLSGGTTLLGARMDNALLNAPRK